MLQKTVTNVTGSLETITDSKDSGRFLSLKALVKSGLNEDLAAGSSEYSARSFSDGNTILTPFIFTKF